jgi:hypothetical protein
MGHGNAAQRAQCRRGLVHVVCELCGRYFERQARQRRRAATPPAAVVQLVAYLYVQLLAVRRTWKLIHKLSQLLC